MRARARATAITFARGENPLVRARPRGTFAAPRRCVSCLRTYVYIRLLRARLNRRRATCARVSTFTRPRALAPAAVALLPSLPACAATPAGASALCLSATSAAAIFSKDVRARATGAAAENEASIYICVYRYSCDAGRAAHTHAGSWPAPTSRHLALVVQW